MTTILDGKGGGVFLMLSEDKKHLMVADEDGPYYTALLDRAKTEELVKHLQNLLREMPVEPKKRCHVCNGTGSVRYVNKRGVLDILVACTRCLGQGII